VVIPFAKADARVKRHISRESRVVVISCAKAGAEVKGQVPIAQADAGVKRHISRESRVVVISCAKNGAGVKGQVRR
jgi:hypothetical protein